MMNLFEIESFDIMSFAKIPQSILNEYEQNRCAVEKILRDNKISFDPLHDNKDRYLFDKYLKRYRISNKDALIISAICFETMNYKCYPFFKETLGVLQSFVYSIQKVDRYVNGTNDDTIDDVEDFFNECLYEQRYKYELISAGFKNYIINTPTRTKYILYLLFYNKIYELLLNKTDIFNQYLAIMVLQNFEKLLKDTQNKSRKIHEVSN